MNITTDIEQERKQKNMRSTEGGNDLIAYFSSLLLPLQKEMDAEEAVGHCQVIINLLPSMDQWNIPVEKQDNNISVSLQGYSEGLAVKIQQLIAATIPVSILKILPGTSSN